MPKKNIHPKWFDEAKVYYDGQLIMVVGSTKRIIDTEGRVERFLKKYKIEDAAN